MLGSYYVLDEPLGGLGFLSGGYDIAGQIVGGLLDLEKQKLIAKQNADLIKQQGMIDRLSNAGQAGGMKMDEAMKLSMMIGIPAVALLVFALVLKKKKK